MGLQVVSFFLLTLLDHWKLNELDFGSVKAGLLWWITAFSCLRGSPWGMHYQSPIQQGPTSRLDWFAADMLEPEDTFRGLVKSVPWGASAVLAAFMISVWESVLSPECEAMQRCSNASTTQLFTNIIKLTLVLLPLRSPHTSPFFVEHICYPSKGQWVQCPGSVLAALGCRLNLSAAL